MGVGMLCRSAISLLCGCMIFLSAACFRESGKPKGKGKKAVLTELPDSQLEAVASRRGLSDLDLLAAVKTYVPTGGRDDYIGLMGTGTGGLLAVYGLPSMRLLKYVGVFTPEPWQGYAYDDQSADLIEASSREDIIYKFGELGLPSLSLKEGQPDGTTLFIGDAAHGRIAILALDDYETKQVVTNPFFRGSYPAIATTADTEYVVQTTEAPEVPQNRKLAADIKANQALMRGGVSFWKTERGEHLDRLLPEKSFTVELPPYLQSRPIAGRGAVKDWVFLIGRCRIANPSGADEACLSGKAPAVLHAINWREASRLAASGKSHQYLALSHATKALHQIELPPGSDRLALSPDGKSIAVTNKNEGQLLLLDAVKIIKAAGSGSSDEYSVSTHPVDQVKTASVNIEGPATDVVAGPENVWYVTTLEPEKFLRIDAAKGAIASSLALDFSPAGIMLPGAETTSPQNEYAVVINKKPQGRFVSVGPTSGLNPLLVDIAGTEMKPLYNMSVPIANSLAGVMVKSDLPRTIIRYKSGTEPRTGDISPLRTVAGQEKVVREGDRVHVFATVIRSHITPDFVEVNEGDTVSFHITNLEQAQDQTHGFTVDTYNVHGSWEPGKTASVTFVADRPGAFPYYCTEFCSALHLEMQGYLLVKPKGWKPAPGDVVKTSSGSTEEDRKIYDQKLLSIEDTQASIDAVVAWLKENNYQSDERATGLVNDALRQLEEAKSAKSKMEAAAKQGNWSSARLWAEQYFQYQVKAADAGLRAKKILSESGAGK